VCDKWSRAQAVEELLPLDPLSADPDQLHAQARAFAPIHTSRTREGEGERDWERSSETERERERKLLF
jgi:hypothetical protein